MKSLALMRSILTTSMLLTVFTAARAQVPAPWNWNQSFWNNPETAKKLNLTSKQQLEMNNLLMKANGNFQLEIRSKLTPEQWKQVQSLHTNHSEQAAMMGLESPDAQRVATVLKVGRAAAQNYTTLINQILNYAVFSGAMRLGASRGFTDDPCKMGSDTVIEAAPNLDATQLRFTFILAGNSYTGKSCPAGTNGLKQSEPVKLIVTYPCAVTSDGVDLAPDCKFTLTETAFAE